MLNVFSKRLLDIIYTKHYIIEIGDNEFRIAIFPDDQDENHPCMSSVLLESC